MNADTRGWGGRKSARDVASGTRRNRTFANISGQGDRVRRRRSRGRGHRARGAALAVADGKGSGRPMVIPPGSTWRRRVTRARADTVHPYYAGRMSLFDKILGFSDFGGFRFRVGCGGDWLW